MATYRSMRAVRLTEQEADHADAVAERQTTGAQRAGRRDGWGDVGYETSLRGKLIGNRGELAFSKWSGIPWQPSFQPQGSRPDVGPYEIKTANMLAPSYDDTLSVHASRLTRQRIVVAVRAWNRYDHDLVGWITGAEAQDLWPATSPRPGWLPRHVIPYGVLHTLDVMP